MSVVGPRTHALISTREKPIEMSIYESRTFPIRSNERDGRSPSSPQHIHLILPPPRTVERTLLLVLCLEHLRLGVRRAWTRDVRDVRWTCPESNSSTIHA